MKFSAEFDYSAIDRSLKRFLVNSRRKTKVVVLQRSKILVATVVKVTPPNRKSSYNRAGGNRTLRNDVRKVYRQSARAGRTANRAEYERLRNRRGRVNRRGVLIAISNLSAFIEERQKKVGILASGWNAAALKLGLRLPGWITRHGTRYGSCQIRISDSEISVRIQNAVRFGGDVEGLNRRIQWALDYQAELIERQLEAFAGREAARNAGLAVK